MDNLLNHAKATPAITDGATNSRAPVIRWIAVADFARLDPAAAGRRVHTTSAPEPGRR